MRPKRVRQLGLSSVPRPVGAFPEAGPVTYLQLSRPQILAAMRGPYPASRTWYHATSWDAAVSACRYGLLPSCWWGSDTCCVCGYDRPEDLPEYRRRDWILEIHSAALPGQVKCWWVPAYAIQGGWYERSFHQRSDLLTGSPSIPKVGDGCWCDLSALSAAEIYDWRRSIQGR